MKLHFLPTSVLTTPAPLTAPSATATSSRATSRRTRYTILIHLLVILLYTAAVLAFTWPLVLHLTDQSLKSYDYVIQGGVDPDRDQFIWNLWWTKKALFDFHTNPYQTTFLYYPYGVPLYLQALTPLDGVIAAIFAPWLGWLGAYNTVCLIIFVWCGYSTFLLADYLIGDKRVAFIAGIFFTLSPQHYFNLHFAQLNVISQQFLPLYFLYIIKLDRFRARLPGWKATIRSWQWWRYSMLAAIWLVCITITDQYIFLFCLIITGFYFLWQAVPSLWRRDWRPAISLVGRLLPALILAGLILAPFLYATYHTISSDLWSKLDNESLPSDFDTMFMPPVNNIFIGSQASDLGRAFFIQPNPRSYSVGLVGLILAIYGAIQCREARWWGWLTTLCLVMALGADLQFNGQSTGIMLPGYWLNQLPIFSVTRYAKRWVGPATLAMAIAAAWGIKYHLNRIAQRGIGKIRLKQVLLMLVVVSVFMFEAEPWPIPMSGDEDTLPKIYANNVLPATDDRAILELPIVEKNVAKSSEMYWQTSHERPMLSGFISRPYDFNYEDSTLRPFLNSSSLSEPDFVDLQATDLQSLLASYNFGYIVLYKFQNSPAVITQWHTFTQNLLGPQVTPFYEDDQTVVYQLPEPGPANPVRPILLSGAGWDNPEKQLDGGYARWLIHDTGDLWLYMPPAQLGAINTFQLKFEATAYYRDRTVNVLVNGQLATTFKVGQTLQPYTLGLPAHFFNPGDNEIIFQPVEPPDSASNHGGSDPRPLTIQLSHVSYGVVTNTP